ncbi:kinesin-like protein KIF16B [Pomacea canaliculata]|uniref:kinesin-like protein KIF16B n=1 Tax=Pomacea canaliculata TaxID=400727 RepID=UPI000D730A27|nr:kinesin-like protein KIF16B [Pomacea canaliculata]
MTSIKVAVRVRPPNQREDGNAIIIEMEGSKTKITNPKVPEAGGEGDHGRDQLKLREFTFDYSFWSVCSTDSHFIKQEQVFEALGLDVVSAAYEGYNVCVFAYGQTGSGKTFTMMGSQDNPGFIPRFCEEMFARMSEQGATYRTQVSYLEIYNEKVRDLLKYSTSGKSSHRLRIREHPKDGPYVQDLSHHTVVSYDGIASLMNRGNSNRTTASTLMNDVSSRSHAIFTITFTQAKFQDGLPSERQSKIHLVDLAGSERADASGATGQRLKEGGSINRSLVTLGNVISVLAEMSENKGHRTRGTFIPYRDSVLTWLLKDSLGGNVKTVMIATISPADINYGETLSTLRYANRAKNIINRPTVNEDPNVRLIRELREEIARLKSLLGGNLDNISSPKVQERLHENEARIKVLTEEWAGKWRESASILQVKKELGTSKEGRGVVLDSTLPHLIGIDDDILSTGIMLYHLKEGITTIGSDDSDEPQDITITGPNVEPQHCVIEYRHGSVTLHPIEDSLCEINGAVINEPVNLTQGAVILLGKTNMFRFNHPAEAQKLKQMRKSTSSLCLYKSRILNNSHTSLLSHSLNDLYRSNDSLAVVAGWEFEESHREDQELLDRKRQEIQELEDKYKQKDDDWQKQQEELEQQLEESQKQLLALEDEMTTLRETMSPAKSIEEALRRLEEEEKKTQQKTTVLREELLQELRDLSSRHEATEASIAASLTELDNQVSSKQTMLMTLEEEIAHRRKALLTDKQKKEDQMSTLTSEVTAVREHLNVERERLLSEDSMLKEKYYIVLQKEAALRKEHAQLDQEKNIDWKKILDIFSEENYHIEEAWNDLVQHEQTVNERLLKGEFSSEEERNECEFDKYQLEQARVLLKEEEDKIAATQQKEMERLEGEMEKWAQQKENEISLLQRERDDLMRHKSKEMSDLLAQLENKLTAFNEQQEKCCEADKMLSCFEDEAKKQISGLLADQKKLLELKNLKMEEQATAEEEKKKVEAEIQTRLVEVQQAADTELQKIYEEKEKLLGLRKQAEEEMILGMVQKEDTVTGDILKEQQKALEDSTKKCQMLTEQVRILQEQLAASQHQHDVDLERELDSLEFKKLQLQDLERQERINALVEQEVKRRLFEEKVEREKQRRMEREQERLERDKEIHRLKSLHEREIRQLKARLENSNGHNRSNPYSRSLTHSSSFDGSRRKLVAQLSLSDPPPPVNITIPNYELRGSGRDSHYEYEVKVTIGDDIWSVFRRYSRFRELHQTMRKKYPTVDILIFPPRRLFHRNERVASERRVLLEQYLNNLVEACMRCPDCPLHPENNRYLSKPVLAKFDLFFQRGLFEHARNIAT